MNPTHPKFVRWAVMLGIVIALNLFFFAARSLVLAEPLYEDFCPMAKSGVATTTQSCKAQNGDWVQTTDGAKTAPTGYCDFGRAYTECQPGFDTAMKNYQMNAFVIMVGLGVLALIAGVIPMGSSIVSTGLSYGGVLALVVAAANYWGEAGSLLKLGMSLVALAALIYIGARRFKDKE